MDILPDGFETTSPGCCESGDPDASPFDEFGIEGNIDTNGDGVVDQTAIDTTGDGVVDTWNIDTDGDLVANQVALDTNGDGVVDTWNIDMNQDGLIEETQWDTDGDGLPESVASNQMPGPAQVPSEPTLLDPPAEQIGPERHGEADNIIHTGDETLDSILERAERTTDPAEKERLLDFAQNYQQTMIDMSRVWL